MTNLTDIKSEPIATRRLTNIKFGKGSELTYTDASQGGACSLKNDSYLMKANAEKSVSLTENQQAILASIDEEFTPLVKNSKPDDSSPSVTDKVSEDDNLNKSNLESTMTEEQVIAMQKELADQKLVTAGLVKSLAVEKATNAIVGYGLESDVQKDLANAMADLSEEGSAAVTKAMDAIVAKVEKDNEDAVSKAADEDKPNDIAKALSDESGHEEVQAPAVVKSMVEALTEINDKEGAK